jgi:hypothetical protein
MRGPQVSKYEYDQLQKNGVPRNVQQLDDSGQPTGHVIRQTVPVRTEAPPVKRVKWVNKRTGEEEMVPEELIRAGTTILARADRLNLSASWREAKRLRQ